MDPLKKLAAIRAKAEKRTSFIDKQLDDLEKIIEKMGNLLNKKIVEEFLNELEVKDGTIVSSAQNQRKIALIEKAYQTFVEQQSYKIINRMIEDIYEFSGMHVDYFQELTGSKLDPKAISSIIDARLGLNEKGELKRDGFMKGLLDDPTVKKDIINYANEKVLGGTGYEDLRKGFRDLIEGDQERMGAFKQFYRNAAYDTYTRTDALNAKLWADKLKVNKYFIYAGTRRKASRQFCIERKGKVFTAEEALEWKNLFGKRKTITDENGKTKSVSIAPQVLPEDQATYNPFIDRGGYGCVDDIMWISEEIAFAKRPDLKK